MVLETDRARSIFVGNLPRSFDTQSLLDIVRDVCQRAALDGELIEAAHVTLKRGFRARYAFVLLPSPQFCIQFIAAASSVYVEDRQLTISCLLKPAPIWKAVTLRGDSSASSDPPFVRLFVLDAHVTPSNPSKWHAQGQAPSGSAPTPDGMAAVRCDNAARSAGQALFVSHGLRGDSAAAISFGSPCDQQDMTTCRERAVLMVGPSVERLNIAEGAVGAHLATALAISFEQGDACDGAPVVAVVTGPGTVVVNACIRCLTTSLAMRPTECHTHPHLGAVRAIVDAVMHLALPLRPASFDTPSPGVSADGDSDAPALGGGLALHLVRRADAATVVITYSPQGQPETGSQAVAYERYVMDAAGTAWIPSTPLPARIPPAGAGPHVRRVVAIAIGCHVGLPVGVCDDPRVWCRVRLLGPMLTAPSVVSIVHHGLDVAACVAATVPTPAVYVDEASL